MHYVDAAALIILLGYAYHLVSRCPALCRQGAGCRWLGQKLDSSESTKLSIEARASHADLASIGHAPWIRLIELDQRLLILL